MGKATYNPQLECGLGYVQQLVREPVEVRVAGKRKNFRLLYNTLHMITRGHGNESLSGTWWWAWSCGL